MYVISFRDVRMKVPWRTYLFFGLRSVTSLDGNIIVIYYLNVDSLALVSIYSDRTLFYDFVYFVFLVRQLGFGLERRCSDRYSILKNIRRIALYRLSNLLFRTYMFVLRFLSFVNNNSVYYLFLWWECPVVDDVQITWTIIKSARNRNSIHPYKLIRLFQTTLLLWNHYIFQLYGWLQTTFLLYFHIVWFRFLWGLRFILHSFQYKRRRGQSLLFHRTYLLWRRYRIRIKSNRRIFSIV